MRLISADSKWWWNGESWQPRPEPAIEVEATHSRPAPALPFVPGRFDRSGVAPARGFAAGLHRLSGGRINLKPSATARRRLHYLEMARTPATDPPLHIAVASAKGGVGKSTMALLLASKLGLLRTDRIIAVECNPHHGTFRSRIRAAHDRSVKDLIDFLDGPDLRNNDDNLTVPMLHRFTTHVPESRLEVITAPTDPRIRQALRVEDYRRVLHALERYFDIIVLDLGTGLLDETTKHILEKVCDQLVVVAPAELDGAELGAFTLEFVAGARGVEWMRQRAVVVINRVVKDTQVDVAGMESYFRGWARACIRISQDRHLKTGGIFDWNRVSRVAGDEVLAMTAEIAGGFALGRSNCG